jgi:hypothetical protein
MNAQIKTAFSAFSTNGNAYLTNRLIDTDPSFACPEWQEDGDIEGVPVSVFYRTEIPEMEEGEEYDWVDNVNWNECIESIEINIHECDRQDITDDQILAIKSKYGI